MPTEKERWAKLAGLPEPTDKQQLDENVVGIGAIKEGSQNKLINDYGRYDGPTNFEGTLDFYTDDKIKTLGSLETVSGGLNLRENKSIESLGSLTTVGGTLNLFGTNIKSLGNLKKVGGDFHLGGTEIAKNFSEEEIREKVEVGGRVFLSHYNDPETTDKSQLDENFVGIGMVGNIFDREKEKYEDAFEYFLSEMYEKEEKVEEELATPQQLDLSSLKSNIIRATQSFKNKEELKNYLLGLVEPLGDDLFKKEK